MISLGIQFLDSSRGSIDKVFTFFYQDQLD